MRGMWKVCALGLTIALMAAIAAVALTAQATVALDSEVDRVFSRWTTATPGCTVGVSDSGRSVLQKAYGMADLEHDVPNTPETIIEAGSVSKQFTAAAVLLLAREGKLSLDDPVRKHVPEVPDFGAPLAIRHMLNHTSGLRDWGNVAAIAGWPRTSRVHTHAHVLDIVSRQRALNFPSGTRYSYSNTGYNLAAIIVSRVSGQAFADFTRVRLFEPLGMTRTSWRDDYRRVVKGRAIAYASERDGFHSDMPFENVHGNGGLLTTVGDLLKWNANFDLQKVGDAAFVREQQEAGRFNDGRQHNYALGLTIGQYKGLREVSHSGSTAGYRAFLTRFPDARLSVAVLCNAGTANATQYAHAVADLYLADRLKRPVTTTATFTPSTADIDARVGLYRHTVTGLPTTFVRDGNALKIEGGGSGGGGSGTSLVALSAARFVTGDGGPVWELDGRGGARRTDQYGTSDSYERVASAKPGSMQLAEFAGSYASDEAETSITVSVDGDVLVLKRRPDSIARLSPLYADAFTGPMGLIRFRRDVGGKVTAFSVTQDRVWDLRFQRQPSGATSQ
jgi:CubicO group peptidase (beta-lactamase class C family)